MCCTDDTMSLYAEEGYRIRIAVCLLLGSQPSHCECVSRGGKGDIYLSSLQLICQNLRKLCLSQQYSSGLGNRLMNIK